MKKIFTLFVIIASMIGLSTGCAQTAETPSTLPETQTTFPTVPYMPPEDETTTVPLEEWKTLYLMYIKENKIEEEYITFCAGYINDDNIPEIILIHPKADPGMSLLWIEDGIIHQQDHIGYGRIFYHAHQEVFYASRIDYGKTIEVIYSLKDGVLSELHRGCILTVPLSPEIPPECTWNGESVTPEEYASYLKNAIDIDTATEMDYSHRITDLAELIISW